jgi:hypothetical protein
MITKKGYHSCYLFDAMINYEVIEVRDYIEEPPDYIVNFGHEEQHKRQPEITWWRKEKIKFCPFCGEKLEVKRNRCSLSKE